MDTHVQQEWTNRGGGLVIESIGAWPYNPPPPSEIDAFSQGTQMLVAQFWHRK